MEITVIIPTYKPKDYIFECLKSLKNQSLSKEYFEILLILNGEKEPYYNLLIEFLEKENMKNVNLIYAPQKGVSNARNLGLDKAKGKYIAFVDDDDYLDNNYLEVMLKTVKLQEDYICCANYKNFDDSNKNNTDITCYLWGDRTEKILKYRRIFSSIGAKLIPRNVIREIRFNTILSNSEDALFMSLITKNVKGILIVQRETFYNRRIRKNSANYRKKKIKDILYVCMYLIKEHFKLLLNKNYDKKFIILRFLAIIKGTVIQIKKSI